jgi:hypothetical protein
VFIALFTTLTDADGDEQEATAPHNPAESQKCVRMHWICEKKR